MLKRAGVEIFAFGMGGLRSKRYLYSMAYDRYHVFNAASRAGLRTVVGRLVAKICAAKPLGKPTPTSKFDKHVFVVVVVVFVVVDRLHE